jgi:hypothetical protein
MPQIQVTRRHLLVPRRNLDKWVTLQAALAQVEHGFTYLPSEDAPSTYSTLLAAYRNSAETGRDETIFITPETNWAMRFVHDLEHAERQLSFSADDEVALGNVHLEVLQAAGYGPDSLEYKLLLADTIGQARCVALLGRFPYRQRLFAFDTLDLGVEAAVELEAVRPCASARVVGYSASTKP